MCKYLQQLSINCQSRKPSGWVIFSRWRDNKRVHPWNRILLSNKIEQNRNICNIINVFQIQNIKWKKPDSKGYILYDSIYTTFCKRLNYRVSSSLGFKIGKRLTTKDQHKGMIWGKQIVLNPNCSGCYMTRHLSKLMERYTRMNALLYNWI